MKVIENKLNKELLNIIEPFKKAFPEYFKIPNQLN